MKPDGRQICIQASIACKRFHPQPGLSPDAFGTGTARDGSSAGASGAARGRPLADVAALGGKITHNWDENGWHPTQPKHVFFLGKTSKLPEPKHAGFGHVLFPEPYSVYTACVSQIPGALSKRDWCFGPWFGSPFCAFETGQTTNMPRDGCINTCSFPTSWLIVTVVLLGVVLLGILQFRNSPPETFNHPSVEWNIGRKSCLETANIGTSTGFR